MVEQTVTQDASPVSGRKQNSLSRQWRSPQSVSPDPPSSQAALARAHPSAAPTIREISFNRSRGTKVPHWKQGAHHLGGALISQTPGRCEYSRRVAALLRHRVLLATHDAGTVARGVNVAPIGCSPRRLGRSAILRGVVDERGR
jgi:hypothetical protein